MNKDKYILINKNGVTSNFKGFKFSYDYISKNGKESPTYLNLIHAEFYEQGNITHTRKFERLERKESGLVLARLAIQVYEDKIDALSEEERHSIHTDGTNKAIGLWSSLTELRDEWGNEKNSGIKPSSEYVADMYLGNAYPATHKSKYYFYNGSFFDSIHMALSLLKKFGNDDDYFKVFIVQKEDIIDVDNSEISKIIPDTRIKKYASKLLKSKNIILSGAPGTGKSFLSKQIAAYLISQGRTTTFENLSDKEKVNCSFVQFHPSYDYTDFVEGLRPYSRNGDLGFSLKDGTFKEFCEIAREERPWFNLEGFALFLKDFGKNEYSNYFPIIEQLLGLKPYTGEKTDDFPTYKNIYALIENIDEIKKFDRDHNFKQWLITPMNYLNQFYEKIVNKDNKYIFIIDEINRGEISNIFGELFFSIDPGYRGKKGSIKTQYFNLHEGNKMFYVPENIYIIGTMNDIDRSVDSFDFAMRRRFRFLNISAEESTIILELAKDEKGNQLLSDGIIEESIRRMSILNDLISSGNLSELNESYQVGASYFLNLINLDGSFDSLWTDYLEPLFKEYLRGSYNFESDINKLKESYFSKENELSNHEI